MSQILTPAGRQLEAQRQALEEMGDRIRAAGSFSQKRKEQRARKLRKKLQRRIRRVARL
jgi:hypothetical protein